MNECYKIFYDNILFSFYSSSFRSLSVSSACFFFFSSPSYRDFFELFSLHSLIVILFVFLPLFQSAHNSFIYPLKTRTDFICGQIRLTLLFSISVGNVVVVVAVLIFYLFEVVLSLFWFETNGEKATWIHVWMYVLVSIMTINVYVVKQLTHDLCNLLK